jgi:hypothetical protein
MDLSDIIRYSGEGSDALHERLSTPHSQELLRQAKQTLSNNEEQLDLMVVDLRQQIENVRALCHAQIHCRSPQ